MNAEKEEEVEGKNDRRSRKNNCEEEKEREEEAWVE